MNVCPYCSHELDAEAKSCPDCGKSLAGRPGGLGLPREFWITLAGTVCVVLITLLNWISINGSNFNLFGLWGASGSDEWLLATFRAVTPIRGYIVSLSILLVLSYVFLLASLIRCKEKERKILTNCGFGLSVFVSAAFHVVILVAYGSIPRLDLTMFPLLTFVVAALTLSVITKTPKSFGDVVKMITHLLIHVSYVALVALLVLTVIDVVRRFIFGLAMTGVTEYSQIFLIVCMTAMAHTMIEGKFIGVSTLVEMFPKWLNITIEVIMGIFAMVFFTLVGVQLIDQVDSSIMFRESYFMIGVPRWPMYAALGVAFLACTLSTIVYVYEKIVNFKDPKQKKVFDDPEIAFMAGDEDADVEAKVGGAE